MYGLIEINLIHEQGCGARSAFAQACTTGEAPSKGNKAREPEHFAGPCCAVVFVVLQCESPTIDDWVP